MALPSGWHHPKRRPRHQRPGLSIGSLFALALGAALVFTCGALGALGVLGVLDNDHGSTVTGAAALPRSASTQPTVDPAQDVWTSPRAGKLAPYTLVVIGDGKATIKYSKDRWEYELGHVTQMPLPWEYAMTKRLDGPFDPVITAKRLSGGPGSIACQIRRGKTILVTETASGPYARVNC